MKIINEIKNRINEKEREEIESLTKELKWTEKYGEAYYNATNGNHLAVYKAINILVERGVLSEEDINTFYDVLYDESGYVKPWNVTQNLK